MTTVVFFVAVAVALGGALGVVLMRNPVHSALNLVMTLVAVAVLFLLQGAQLVAAVQVIVYASAIVVLFLFVIMLLGVDREESMIEPLRFQRPAALALVVIGLAEVLFLAGRQWATGAEGVRNGTAGDGGGNVERVARSLFTDFLWPFEITAVLLVLAVVGGVVLARRSHQPTDDEVEEASSGGGESGGTDRVSS
ncbi:MAG TPA: NADH-quinone oxidoreductase subunit J [Acidimicrobiia bacterium]|nr:NADH-quinone oxidoreductase subunit J [Acidimicrobiia bacterium]